MHKPSIVFAAFLLGVCVTPTASLVGQTTVAQTTVAHTTVAQTKTSSDELRRSYIDDDDHRRLADLKFRVDDKTARSLRITISATGPNVEPIGGFRGIHGSNRYTAEELDLVLRGLHESVVITTTEQGDVIEGRISAGNYGSVFERRLKANGRIDFLHGTVLLPLSIEVDTGADSNQFLQTTLVIDGQSRLTCRYRIQGGKIVDLETQSLGHDGYIAQEGRASDRRNRWMTATAAEVKVPVEGADWANRDLEGRWVLMMSSLDDSPQRISEWVAWLVQEEQFELLEWLAIYQPDAFKSHGVGKALLKADAPQWIRVAAWHRNTSPYLGHGRQQATQMLLEASPGIVEHWLQTYQSELDNWEPALVMLHGKLQSDDIASEDSTKYSKPLQPDRLFDVLSSRTKVAEFGDRLRAEDQVVYEHQILRAINAVVISGRRTDKLKGHLKQLVDHPNQRIRIEALLTHSFLLPKTKTERPSRLLEIVDDSNETNDVRQAALLGVSYQDHPSIILKLHDIASDVQHPAWNAAVSRIGDVGKGYSILILSGVPKDQMNAKQLAVLQDSMTRLLERAINRGISTYEVAELIRLTSVAKLQKHSHAGEIEKWVRAKLDTVKPNTLAILKNKYPANQLANVVPIWEPDFAADWQNGYSAIFDEVTAGVALKKK